MSTKKQLLQKVASDIEKIGLCNKICPVKYNYIYELINNHPEAERKLNNFSHLKIGVNPKNKYQKALFVVYKDGTYDSISYVSCITKRKQSSRALLKKVLRNEINLDIWKFKIRSRSEFDFCDICVTKLDNTCEVDHFGDYEFNTIAEMFIGQLSNTPIIDEEKFVDRCLANDWVNFHNTYAKLQVLCKVCHKKKTYNIDESD